MCNDSFVIVSQDGLGRIAETKGGFVGDAHPDEEQANARLIAAAPEMLEALKANVQRLYIYKRVIQDRQDWTGDKHGSCHHIKALTTEIGQQEALIALAEGRD